ncbi:MAG: hypothetical protein JRG91_20825, partial [Deltaproteobacteria bacterium]|nr:hypothetical protein [Deltaproteobacteria bacterium]
SEYDFESVSIDGDDILITISYGGGCEDHHFRLCWDGSFMESHPVQVDLELIHDGHGDACLAYITSTHRFSLVPLKEAWFEAYGTDTGTIMINGDGFSTLYEF